MFFNKSGGILDNLAIGEPVGNGFDGGIGGGFYTGTVFLGIYRQLRGRIFSLLHLAPLAFNKIG
jgi:hypothetical protein